MRNTLQNIKWTAVIAGIFGMLFAFQAIAFVQDEMVSPHSEGIMVFVARIGLNLVSVDNPAQMILNLIPLFALMLLLGDDLPKNLLLSGVYKFTRGISRTRWYISRVALLMVCAAVFWVIYGIAYAIVFVIIDPSSLKITGYEKVLATVFFYLVPFTLFILLWVNMLAVLSTNTISCVSMFAVLCLCILLLKIMAEADLLWGVALNPLINASYSWWDQIIPDDARLSLLPFSLVYWAIVLGITIAMQICHYRRIDIL